MVRPGFSIGPRAWHHDPMRLRSSPARRFIIARLLRGRDNAAIRDELDRRRLVGLSGRQLDRLRRELVPPDPFLPHVPDHEPSTRLLQQVGVEAFFRREPAVNEALLITDHPRVQELVETMLLAGAGPNVIARGVEARCDAEVSAAGIMAYSSYLFDLEQLDATETRWLVTRRLRRGGAVDPDLVRHDARMAAVLMPSSYGAMVLAQLRLGGLPKAVDHRKLLEQARSVLSARLLERAVGGSAKDAQAVSQLASALNVVDNIIARSADPNEGVMEIVQHVQLVSDRTRLPSARELCGDRRTVDMQPLGGRADEDAVGEPDNPEDLAAAG